MVAVTIFQRYVLSVRGFMLSQIFKASVPLLAFLFFFCQTAPAKVIEQLIVVIDGEPYTLSNLTLYAKTKMSREFPTGNLTKINASDR
jgi:hypothetical protein